MNAKIFYDMPEEQYFASSAASNSTLGRMKKSPAHCKEYMDNPPEKTPNMKLGSLFHTLVLEPYAFGDRYYVSREGDPSAPRKEIVVSAVEAMTSKEFDKKFLVDDGDKINKPRGAAGEIADTILEGETQEVISLYATTPTDINMRTKGGKEKYAEFEAMCEREGKTICKQEDLDKACEYVNWVQKLDGRELIKNEDYIVAKNYFEFQEMISGKEVISQEMYDTAESMREEVMKKDICRKLFKSGRPEASIFWNDDETDFPCRCRIDWISEAGSGYLVDLKSTGDASLEEFSRSIAKFGYHRQDAMYTDAYEKVGGERLPFIFIAVESKPPYAVGIYSLDPEGKQKGREEYKDLLADFAMCVHSNNWPAYSDKVETIELPRWYK